MVEPDAVAVLDAEGAGGELLRDFGEPGCEGGVVGLGREAVDRQVDDLPRPARRKRNREIIMKKKSLGYLLQQVRRSSCNCL